MYFIHIRKFEIDKMTTTTYTSCGKTLHCHSCDIKLVCAKENINSQAHVLTLRLFLRFGHGTEVVVPCGTRRPAFTFVLQVYILLDMHFVSYRNMMESNCCSYGIFHTWCAAHERCSDSAASSRYSSSTSTRSAIASCTTSHASSAATRYEAWKHAGSSSNVALAV